MVLKDQVGVEEFLWQYIEKYHQQDLDKFCGSRVTYTCHRSASSSMLQLVLQSANGSSVRDATERITCLYQKLAANITETTFLCPNGADRTAFWDLGRGIAENAKSVFHIDREHVCHVIGPKDRVSSVEREILGAWRDHQRAVVGQRTLSKTTGYRVTTRAGINVEVYTGNLLHDNVDAVVNPANVHLRHGGGAARAIADAAGQQLKQECLDHLQRYGNLEFTQVIHTSAGNMYPPVRYVIHAAGPPADQYKGNSAALRQAVMDTFFNCLRHANEQLHIRSISIPAISSGAQCYLRHCRTGAL